MLDAFDGPPGVALVPEPIEVLGHQAELDDEVVGQVFRLGLVLKPAQIRAARALLGWRQEDLSKASGVGTATIHRIEKSDRPVTGYVSTVLRIQAAFEQAGIQFLEADQTGGFGLRMAKTHRKPLSL
jgi:DNA-binding XRE family transcriptional regulator